MPSREATDPRAGQRRSPSLIRLAASMGAFLAVLLSLLVAAPPAPAAEITGRPELFSFDGSGTTAGAFAYAAPYALAIDYSCLEHEPPLDETTTPKCSEYDLASGSVYVLDSGREVLDKFNLAGVAQSFASTGESSLPTGQTSSISNLAVDDSTANPGRIHLRTNRLKAFGFAGEFLWRLPGQGEPGGYYISGVGVDAEGHPWLGENGEHPGVHEYESSGSPPAQISFIELPGMDDLDLGADGTLYVAAAGGLLRYPIEGTGTLSAAKGRGTLHEDSTTVTSVSASEGAFEAGMQITAQGIPANTTIVSCSPSCGPPATELTISKPATSSGVRDLAAGSTLVTSLTVSGSFAVGMQIFGPGIAAAATVAECRPSCAAPTELLLSTPATKGGSAVPLRSRKTIDPEGGRGLSVDQSSAAGHVFSLHNESFEEYDAAGAPLGEYAKTVIRSGAGIAYDPATDRVYVSDDASRKVKVFGPPITATVPAATIAPATGVGPHEATLNGTVNPNSVPTSYFFQWKQGTGKEWGSAEESTPQSLPEDGEDHEVSLPVEPPVYELRSNTTYQFRLIAENTEKRLRSISAVEEFTTLPPPSPVVENLEVTDITTSSATVEATIRPEKDRTTWWVFRKALPGATKADCEALADSSAFEKAKEGTISVKEAEEHETIPITAALSGLQPAQTSCVRVTAQNGNPIPAVPKDEVFQTLAVAPGEAKTAFVAPRLDTTATINAWVNPEGEKAFTYSFEVSEDGGASWSPLPERHASVVSWQPILVGEEVTGLKPAATYLYRLALAANYCKPTEPEELCPASGLPTQARSFTTRTTVEVTLPPNTLGEADKRGTELVNSPDKGTQNLAPGTGATVYPIHPTSSGGDQMLWTVAAGAPGANTASGDLFLSRRTGQSEAAPNGWESKSLIPPPAEQLGGGSYHYAASGATPDFSRFFFKTGREELAFEDETAWVRLPRGGGEEVLASEAHGSANGSFAEASEDGSHFVLIDESGRLVDLEAPGKETLLSLMPDGAPSACPLRPGPSWPGNAGLGHDGVTASHRTGYSLIARADASRAYFQAQPPGECGGEGEPAGLYGLYVRNRETGQSALIDPGSFGRNPELIRASADGREAYYVTHSKCRRWKYPGLSCETDETADTNAHADVYRWDEEAGAEGESSCLTCQLEDEAGEKIEDVDITPQTGAGLGTPVIVSDDSSHIYFSSERQLIPGEGEPTGGNLYLADGTQLRFVAPLGGDVLDSGNAEASADGKVLAFSSLEANVPARRLTADAVAADCPNLDQRGTTSHCIEFYRYEAPAASLECLSCLRGGLTTQSFRGANVNGLHKPLGSAPAGFALSRDGSTLAFTTAQALVPSDINDGTDVYEWRTGQLRLITNGEDRFAEGVSGPNVSALDDDGSDLFFAVGDPGLTGYEHDELRNLYDARIGGGFPRPSPPAHCSEESCQGPLQAPPAEEQPASGNPSRGNVTEGKPRCPRGKVRRRGRCVKVRHKRKHHRRTHKRTANTNRRAGK